MQIIASIAWVLSILALIIGTIRPRTILRWGKDEEKNIGKVTVVCYPIILILSAINGILLGESNYFKNAVVFMFLWSFLLLILGLTSPRSIIWWGQDDTKTRIKLIKSFVPALVVLFFFARWLPATPIADDVTKNQRIIKQQEQQAAQKAKAEQEAQAKIVAEKRDKEEAAKKEEEKSKEYTTKTSDKPVISNEQTKEMLEAFNKLESNNNFKDFYAGVNASSPYRLQVIVSEYWNVASKDMKIGYIKHVVMLWGGMSGARGTPIKPDDLKVEFIHDVSGRRVATWDSLWGTSIKD